MYQYNMMDPQAVANEQEMLRQRIQQLEQARSQQLNMYNAPQQPQVPASNVNWIQVAGIDGAKSQIVQPGHTAWMMDNNIPVFYVKSVDGMGSATFKAYSFTEIAPTTPEQPRKGEETSAADYVTREEFNALIARIDELSGKEENA